MRRLGFFGLVVALALTGSPAAGAAPAIERLAGASRYETAAAVAGLLHPEGAETVVVVAGTNYPDALAAGVAAAALDAPLLLASRDEVPVDAVNELGAREVLVIGGTAALPDSVVYQLGAGTGARVRRIAGANRYDTSGALAEIASPTATLIFEVSGDSFETALVAAVHAARVGARLLLVPHLGPGVVRIDGDDIRGDVGAVNQSLLTRYPPTGGDAIVTTISSFPDALSAATVAGAFDAPVLFTTSVAATQASVDLVELLDPSSLLVIGGTAAVSPRVLHQLLGFVPVPPAVAPGAADAIARDLFARANAERSARGVAPLTWDARLAAEAQDWAREMSRTGYRHADLPSTVGENIHMPSGWCDDTGCHHPTSGLLHRDWMASTGNRDNIVERGYVIAGFGVYCAPDGTLWSVERFGVGFEGLSSGGSPPAPIARPDTGGAGCAGTTITG